MISYWRTSFSHQNEYEPAEDIEVVGQAVMAFKLRDNVAGFDDGG
jgi:hypothetical protein